MRDLAFDEISVGTRHNTPPWVICKRNRALCYMNWKSRAKGS